MKYLLFFCLLSTLVISAEENLDIIDEATRTINLELGGIVG